MARRLAACLLASGLACAAAGAAPFADPTLPPSADGASADGSAAPGTGPRLESVLIAPDRRVAVISGQAVQVGGKYGEARVVRITESEVVLRQGQETQVLRLYPASQKRAAGERRKTK